MDIKVKAQVWTQLELARHVMGQRLFSAALESGAQEASVTAGAVGASSLDTHAHAHACTHAHAHIRMHTHTPSEGPEVNAMPVCTGEGQRTQGSLLVCKNPAGGTPRRYLSTSYQSKGRANSPWTPCCGCKYVFT